MKSLDTLIKLQKTRVDEQRQVLSKLQGMLEDIEASITMLAIKKAREQVVANENPDARHMFGIFIKTAIRDGRALEKQRMAAATAVEVARNKLAEIFEEQKRYEIAAAARTASEDAEERRRETIQLDEVGSVSFIRGKE